MRPLAATVRLRPAGGCGPAPASGIQPSGIHPQPGPGGVLADVPEPKPKPTRATPPVTSQSEDIPKGNRNDTLFREGARLRHLGHSRDEIRERLTTINAERCRPPLDTQELDTIATSVARYKPATDTDSLSDTGNAKRFAKLNAENLRYDHPQHGWFVHRDHHWRPDTDGAVDRLALDTIQARQRAAVGNEAASRWGAKSLSRTCRESMIKLARSERPIATNGEHWDEDPMLLGVKDGVFDLRTGQFRDGRADDYITKVAPVTFDAGAECPRWLQFLEEIFADNQKLIPYMRRVAGYIITGVTTEQVFFVLHGVGANGKTHS